MDGVIGALIGSVKSPIPIARYAIGSRRFGLSCPEYALRA
jgi:hypothetical protein